MLWSYSPVYFFSLPFSFSSPFPPTTYESCFPHLTSSPLSILRVTLLIERANMYAPAKASKPCTSIGLPHTVDTQEPHTPALCSQALFYCLLNKHFGIQASSHLAQPTIWVGGTNSQEYKGELDGWSVNLRPFILGKEAVVLGDLFSNTE